MFHGNFTLLSIVITFQCVQIHSRVYTKKVQLSGLTLLYLLIIQKVYFSFCNFKMFVEYGRNFYYVGELSSSRISEWHWYNTNTTQCVMKVYTFLYGLRDENIQLFVMGSAGIISLVCDKTDISQKTSRGIFKVSEVA